MAKNRNSRSNFKTSRKMRIELPQLPMSTKDRRRIRKTYAEKLNATEGVDNGMINESIDNYYKPQIDYTNKVCLDLGSNVGAFTQIALDLGAKHVTAVECDRRNFSKLEESFKGDTSVNLIEAAVTGTHAEKLKLYKSSAKNKHCSTTIYGKSRYSEYDEVDNVHISTLLEKYKPQIIKIDIEGAEYTLMDEILDYFPEVLFIELHGTGKNATNMELYTNLLKEKYKHSEIEPLIVFKSVWAHDCLFYK